MLNARWWRAINKIKFPRMVRRVCKQKSEIFFWYHWSYLNGFTEQQGNTNENRVPYTSEIGSATFIVYGIALHESRWKCRVWLVKSCYCFGKGMISDQWCPHGAYFGRLVDLTREKMSCKYAGIAFMATLLNFVFCLSEIAFWVSVARERRYRSKYWHQDCSGIDAHVHKSRHGDGGPLRQNNRSSGLKPQKTSDCIQTS